MSQVCISALVLLALYTVPPPDAGEIVRKSVANTQMDWNAAPEYNFTERDVVVANRARSVKTYRVIMIDGSPYNKLIAANGTPLGTAQAAAQESKLQQEVARRQHETPSQRQRRIAEYQRERRQDNDLLREMIKAMNFRVAGEEVVDGRRCFVLEGDPNPEYRPISRDTRVLRGMRGKLWIDEQQYQWVKVEAEVFRPVAFGLFIAHVEPGTRFTLDQRPVQGGLWLPSHFSMQVRAKVLQLWSHNSNDDETYSAYSRRSRGGPALTARISPDCSAHPNLRPGQRFAMPRSDITGDCPLYARVRKWK